MRQGPIGLLLACISSCIVKSNRNPLDTLRNRLLAFCITARPSIQRREAQSLHPRCTPLAGARAADLPPRSPHRGSNNTASARRRVALARRRSTLMLSAGRLCGLSTHSLQLQRSITGSTTAEESAGAARRPHQRRRLAASPPAAMRRRGTALLCQAASSLLGRPAAPAAGAAAAGGRAAQCLV